MNDVARIEYPARAVAALWPPLIGSTQHREHPVVHLLIEPDRKEHPLVAVEIFAEYAVELGDRISLVGAVIDHRALDAGAAAGPGLALLVARANEQHELPILVSGRDHRD